MPLIELRFGFAHDGNVGVTKSAATHLDQELSRARRRFGHVLKLRSLLRLEEPIGDHLVVLLLNFLCCCGVHMLREQSRCRNGLSGKMARKASATKSLWKGPGLR